MGTMSLRTVAALALVVTALAGCLGAPSPAAAGDADATATGEKVTYHLEPGRRLSTSAPKGGPVGVEAVPWTEAFVGEDLPPWVGPAPDRPMLAQGNATLTLYYRVDRPVGPVLPDPDGSALHLVPWFGSATTDAGSGSASGPPVLVPGETYSAEVPIPLPAGGFRLTPDAPVQVLIAALMNTQDATPIEYLVGSPETPSRVTFEASPVEPVDRSREATERVGGTIPANGGLLAGLPDREGVNRATHELTVGEGTRMVHLALTQKEPPVGKHDLDLTVHAPDGDVAATGSTPFGEESAVLWPETLAEHGTGTYTVVVDAYSGAMVDYEVEATGWPGGVGLS